MVVIIILVYGGHLHETGRNGGNAETQPAEKLPYVQVQAGSYNGRTGSR